ncbi:YuzF family protein [Mesobacillus selenatarsenatis]|uniref:YuzF family protein n=1 Tax=Mesobacillus selenatarsenatis TaxID=388741 RepID=UPI001FD82894|nr:YuzF family protein [Mesobacillus selenatarsenatis]
MMPNGMYSQGAQNGPMNVVVVEPYVYAALRNLIGKRVVLDTKRGSVSGVVRDAKPDHVVVQEHDSTFFGRIREIVWIMPEN